VNDSRPWRELETCAGGAAEAAGGDAVRCVFGGFEDERRVACCGRPATICATSFCAGPARNKNGFRNVFH
jgi:hypothetical protein